MADLNTDYGRDEWRPFGDGTSIYVFRALLSSFVPDASVHFVTEILAAELTVTGYAPQVADTPVRTVDTVLHMTTYAVAGIDLGTPDVGEEFQWLSLEQQIDPGVPDPAADVVVGFWDLTAQATAGVPLILDLGPDGIIHYHY